VTWAPAQVILRGRTIGDYTVAYTRGLKVTELDPTSTVTPSGESPPGLPVTVRGQAFLAAHGTGLRCRFSCSTFDVAPLDGSDPLVLPGTGNFVEVLATFRLNSTLACEAPPLVQ
jgi:hypothetical protein